jgi:copper(I)-binding protein
MTRNNHPDAAAWPLAGIMLALGIGAAVAADATVGKLAIQAPWTRATVGVQQPAALYMTIRNDGGEADRLLGVEAAIADHAQIHDSEHGADGVMRMRPVEAVALPPGGSVTFGPGGLHVMLMGLHEKLKAGSSIPVQLRFEHAGEVLIQVPVEALGAKAG